MTEENPWYPDDRPWVEYDGSGKPVADGTVVECIFRHERASKLYGTATIDAYYLSWGWYCSLDHSEDLDIVAYLVVEKQNG